MFVDKKIMYHYLRNDTFPELWSDGNEFIVDNKFNSEIMKYAYESSSLTPTTSGYYSLDKILDTYEEHEMKHLINSSKYVIHMRNIAIRELALEQFRKDNYPHLPSRFHSIWLCDEEGLEFWGRLFNNDYMGRTLVKLEISGNLLKTSDEFLIQDGESYINIYNEAEKYWNPDFTKPYDKEKVEYLFQGKVKVLGRVKNK